MRIDWDKLMIHPINIEMYKNFIERATGNHAVIIKLGSYKNSRQLYFLNLLSIYSAQKTVNTAHSIARVQNIKTQIKRFYGKIISELNNFIDEIIPQAKRPNIKKT